jgi:nitrite reductase (NADH) large subunit
MNTGKNWKCDVCGYIHTGDEPPDPCPICGVDDTHFVRFQIEPAGSAEQATSWRCAVCGYVHGGDGPPDPCPVCGVPAVHFSPQTPTEVDESSPTTSLHVVIIGAGVAGITAAETLIASGVAHITMISAERHRPYFRLNLTRHLAGEVDEPSLFMKPLDWFAQHSIRFMEDTVTDIHRDTRTLQLRSGETLTYDRLILATGAHSFVPPLSGVRRQGVHVLRTLEDSQALLQRVGRGVKCVCIGGGLLGLEAAGALQKRGCEVTVLEGWKWVLPRQLPEPGGHILARHLEKAGIRLRTEAMTRALEGDEEVRQIQLEDETRLEADLVLISTGVRPNCYLALQCGLEVDGGILVDDEMRTSDANIFAAGDVTRHRGVLYGIWPAAWVQGAVAASNAVGHRRSWAGMPPSNRLKVLDVDLFSIGVISPQDSSYRVVDLETDGTYMRLVARDNVLQGAVLIGDTALASRLQEAIETATQLSEWPDLKALFSSNET